MGTAITSPVNNGEYAEHPPQQFQFDDGITDEIVTDRRHSECFVPVQQPRKRSVAA